MKKSGSLVFLPAAAGCPQLWAAEGVLAADAYVSTAAPNLNFGALRTLNVGGGSTAFLRFDLSALPPGTTSASIASAEQIVYVNRVGVAGHVDLHTVTASWTESGLTSASSNINPAALATAPVAVANNFTVVDVTTLVRSWVGGVTPNYGIAISAAATDSNTQIFLDSKENVSTSHPARLQIDLAGPAGPAGPTGPTGPMGPQGVQDNQGPQGVPGTSLFTFIAVSNSQVIICQDSNGCTFGPSRGPNSIFHDISLFGNLNLVPINYHPISAYTKVAVVCPNGYFRVSALAAQPTGLSTAVNTIYYLPLSNTEIDFVLTGTAQNFESAHVGGTILCMTGIRLNQ